MIRYTWPFKSVSDLPKLRLVFKKRAYLFTNNSILIRRSFNEFKDLSKIGAQKRAYPFTNRSILFKTVFKRVQNLKFRDQFRCRCILQGWGRRIGRGGGEGGSVTPWKICQRFVAKFVKSWPNFREKFLFLHVFPQFWPYLNKPYSRFSQNCKTLDSVSDQIVSNPFPF